MELNKIPGCCSMVTIEGNPYSNTSKKSFLQEVLAEIRKKNLNPHQVKAVLMITNGNLANRLRYFFMGFRKISTYKGAQERKAHIMIYKFPGGFSKYYENYSLK